MPVEIAAVDIVERYNGYQLALQRAGGGGDPRRLHQPRRNGRQAGFAELVDARRKLRGGGIHLAPRIPSREVAHEFAGFLDIGTAVLDGPVALAAAGTEPHHRRVIRDGVEEAERRQVD